MLIFYSFVFFLLFLFFVVDMGLQAVSALFAHVYLFPCFYSLSVLIYSIHLFIAYYFM